MSYSIQPMPASEALVLARWRYDGIYAGYNFSYWDSLSICVAQAVLRLVGASLYYSVRNEAGELVGVFSFIARRENSIEVGVAMRPDQTGHGAGLDFVRAGLAFAQDRFHPDRFQLDVASFNQRARLVYLRAGFTPCGTMKRRVHGKEEDYIKMSRPA